MSDLHVKIKKFDQAARLPEHASDGALCYDLYALDDGQPHPVDANAWQYRTGLGFECSPGWGFKVHSRSGQGFNKAIRLSNSTGLIDPDYRGEVKVSLRFDGNLDVPRPRAGDAIGQIEFVRRVVASFEEVDELTPTGRGAGGFGSTDKPV